MVSGIQLSQIAAMTVTELYNQLSDKDFQDPQTGDLYFRAYMYTYKPEEEYEIEVELLNIKNRLLRPNNYLDVLMLDIFDEYRDFLSQEKFGKTSKLEFYLAQETAKQQTVDKALRQGAYDSRFLNYLDNKIQIHLKNAEGYEVAYVFVKGFGKSFPYIRASRFMNNFEKYIKGYKLIMFYPGEAIDYYSLFGLLKDENLYRAIKLINE